MHTPIVTNISGPLQDAVSGNRYPNLFYSAPWLELLHKEYGFDFFKVSSPNSRDFLIVAKIHHFGFSMIKGIPFCDYIIPSVNDMESLNTLIKQLSNHFRDVPVALKMVLPSSLEPKLLNRTLKHTAYRHTVATSPGMETIENNMDNSFMRGVRKAKSENVEVEIARDKKALHQFYDIYSRQRIGKFEKLPQPLSFFNKIQQTFLDKEQGFILQARKSSTIIAAMIILSHHDTLYYKFGCSVEQYLDHRPNNLLFYELFSYATQQEYTQVDLGLSGVSKEYKGLIRFKEYMGGHPEPIYTLQINPTNYDEKPQEQLKKFTAALTKEIVKQNPGPDKANAYSEILYPYFA